MGSLVSKFASKSLEEFVVRFFSFKLAVNHHHPDLPLAMMLKPPMEAVSIKPDGETTTNSYGQLGIGNTISESLFLGQFGRNRGQP